jgi:hypothetical protein
VVSYTTSIMVHEWLDEIWTEYDKHFESYAIINNMGENPKFQQRNDILWYKERIYLVPS